ncbi:DNA-binding transcriptional regulator, LysR family [Pseudomonas sp. NFACC19-2]|nr:LysR family transcriptional regulator [Pseudomonas sp. NFACC19-2]SFW33012.1 DNA-binding transcriptional regulator, LysR family [Pseudomonas sp. NFACC19-2]
MNRPALLELNAFVAVAQHRSFRRAAVQLQLSPSAISHSVAALERRMGVKLLHRTTRSVALSEAGEQFLLRIGPALDEISAAMEQANHFRQTPMGNLRINTSEGAAQIVLTTLILAYTQRYPDMQLELVTDDALVDIVAQGCDAGIRLLDSVPQDMIAVPLSAPLKLLAVATPNYLRRHGRPETPQELSLHNCIRRRFPSGAIHRWEFAQAGQRSIIDVTGQLTLGNHQLILHAVLNDAGIAMLSEFAASPYLASGELVQLLEPWTPTHSALALFYPANRHPSAGLKAFVELAKTLDTTTDQSQFR